MENTRIVTLEEHISLPQITKKIPAEDMDKYPLDSSPWMKLLAPKLADITGQRLQSMNENHITMQVLSVSGAGADLMDAVQGAALAREYNDAVAQQITPYKGRFAAFAHLPMTAPAAAADELERCVKGYGFKGALINGLTQNRFLDHPSFEPILKRAEELDVPIYLHPGLPPQTVYNAYYSGLPKAGGQLLSIAGWGWHSETALHILRLIVSGTLDKFPKLKLIIGHMGEMLPMMMARTDSQFKPHMAAANGRTIIDTLHEQVHITTSGLFTLPPLMIAIETFGIDNIMFSVDYPFSTNEQGKAYLDSLPLSAGDSAKIAHANADKLLKLV